MKKWISLLLLAVLLFALPCEGALAASRLQPGSIRHEVTGDISEFVVGEELDNATEMSPTMGTDVFLFVDPDTASYVTFYVTDETGRPLRNAQIYVSYNGIEEFYGVTDEDGELSTYLFRDTVYGYRVVKSGYETATGTFEATKSLKTVHVVLRKLYDLTIIVVDNGKPLPGITVLIDGRTYTTDENGEVTVRRTNGEYNVTVVTPDGRHIPVQAVVRGDTTIVVDIGKDDALIEGGRYHDRFLVYNKHYDPEDYELTYFDFSAVDLVQAEEESDKDFALRTARYLQQHPKTVFIAAQPERQQYDNKPDKDRYWNDGTPVYAQRSLMPTGYLLKAWQEMGYTDLTFTNEDFGLHLNMDLLHTGDMAKLFAFLSARESNVHVRSIVTEDMRRTTAAKRMNQLELGSVNLEDVQLDLIRDFEFEFDHARETAGTPDRMNHDLISDSVYENTLFEFRITPILSSALRSMIQNGFSDDSAMVKDYIMIASDGYFTEELRRWRADGKLTDRECDELFAYVVDGMLTPTELAELKEKAEQHILNYDIVDPLLTAALDGKVYRMSCWVIYGEAKVNVTPLLEGMISLWRADELYERELREAMLLNKQDEASAHKAVMQALAASHALLTVDNLGDYIRNYAPGKHTALLDLSCIAALPMPGDEFYAQIDGRWFDALTVDVRKEDRVFTDTREFWYRAYVTCDMTQMPDHYYLTAPNHTSGLAALAPH